MLEKVISPFRASAASKSFLDLRSIKDARTATHSFRIVTPSPEQTLLAFFDHLDERRYDALLSLMTQDAIWHRQGQRLQGHAQILAALQQRSNTQRIRHLVTNLLQRSAGADEARLTHYMTALRHDDGAVHAGPVTIAGPLRMSLVTTHLVRVAGAWRIAEQAIATEFEFAA